MWEIWAGPNGITHSPLVYGVGDMPVWARQWCPLPGVSEHGVGHMRLGRSPQKTRENKFWGSFQRGILGSPL